MDLTPRPFPARASAVSARGMVATSQPLATQAGLRALERGGNAVDAALAAAAVLCVVEPMSTGVGGDCFSLVWREGELTGLNASGRAPAAADPDAMGTAIPLRGPLAVTAPGAVAGWAALAERHGRLGLDRALADAIDIAERGFAVTPVIAGYWAAAAAGASRASKRPPRLPAGPARGPDRVGARAGGDAPADRERGPGRHLPRARSARRSAPSRRSRPTISPRRTPSGSSRCASATAASRSARSRPTVRASPRCRRSASSTASSTRPGRRSTACTCRPRP